MSRLNKDIKSRSDVRFMKLARYLGLPDGRYSACGRMENVWWECLERSSHLLSQEDVALAFDSPEHSDDEIASAIVRAGLAERDGDMLRIKGTKGRIEWLEKLRKNAKKGGKARASQKASQMARRRATKKGAQVADSHSSPPAPAPALTLTLDPVPDPSQDLDRSDPDHNVRRRRRQPASGAHHEFIEYFSQLYLEDQGAKPTWNGKSGAIVKRILKAHGLDECKRRADILFTGAPRWMTARDIQTLENHFDKLAKPVGEGKGHYRHTGDEEYAGGEVDL